MRGGAWKLVGCPTWPLASHTPAEVAAGNLLHPSAHLGPAPCLMPSIQPRGDSLALQTTCCHPRPTVPPAALPSNHAWPPLPAGSGPARCHASPLPPSQGGQGLAATTCTSAAPPDACALATLPPPLVYPDERRTLFPPSQPILCCPSTLQQWGSPSAGPTQQCIASFNTMVQSGLCGQGSPMPVCCSAMAAVGNSCLDAMEAAMAQDPRNYGQLLDIT